MIDFLNILVDAGEEMQEMLDNFEIYFYEKNYKECSKLFVALDHVRSTNNTTETLDDFEMK